MSNYKKKYYKYKQKYEFIEKAIKEPLHNVTVKKPTDSIDFNEDFSKDVEAGIIKLELSHDLERCAF